MKYKQLLIQMMEELRCQKGRRRHPRMSYSGRSEGQEDVVSLDPRSQGWSHGGDCLVGTGTRKGGPFGEGLVLLALRCLFCPSLVLF